MSSRPALLRLSFLVALIFSINQAPAEAKVHRFVPSHEVTVTLELRKPQATGTLVRFARNRLTLTRRRSGLLELRTVGSRAQRLAASSRRSVRVRLVLSGSRGTAALLVGNRTARVARRVVAEDTVVVRSGRAVTALRIRSGAGPTLPPSWTTPAELDRANPGSDAGPDARHDPSSDARGDPGADTGPDAGPDSHSDAGPDVRSDAGPDARSDAGPDAGPDARSDAGPDIRSDAGPDSPHSHAGPDVHCDPKSDARSDPDARSHSGAAVRTQQRVERSSRGQRPA